MEQPENTGNAGFNQAPKRQIKPDEQLLIDEFTVLSGKYGNDFPKIVEYVQKEVERIQKGYKSAEEERQLDIEGGKPLRMTFKVSIPTEKYPNFNYVGRLLGPKGSTLKGMQEISGCKLAVLGKGSMRDKEQEEKCRKEGGKYAHLNEDLHVWLQSFGAPDMAFYKLYVACKEIKKYLHADYNDDIFNEQMMILEQEGGLPKGYTAARAAPRGTRGGTPRGMMHTRGGMSGRGGSMMGGGMHRGGGMQMRGGGMMRGGGSMGMMRGRGGMSRGGIRGGRGGMMRGGASGVPPETLYEDVYEPVPQGFSSGGGSYENGGGGSNNQNASSYFDEFPEPSADASMLGANYRHTQDSYSDGMSMMQRGSMSMSREGVGMSDDMGGGGGMGDGMRRSLGGGMRPGMSGGTRGDGMSGGTMGGGMSRGAMGGGMSGSMGSRMSSGVGSGMGGGMGRGMSSGMGGGNSMMGGMQSDGMRGAGSMNSGGGMQSGMGMSDNFSATSRGFSAMKRMGGDSYTDMPSSKFVRRY